MQLFEGSSTLRAFAVDPRPVFDAFSVEVVLTGSEDGFASLFVSHEADRTNFFPFCIFLDVLELIKFVVVGHLDLVLNGVFVVIGLYECEASLVLLPLLDDPPFDLESSECEEEVFPSDEFMHELDEYHEG